MHRLRIIPWLFGVGLVLTTLVGANRLLHNDPASAGGPPKAAPVPVSGESLVAKGTVLADPPTIAYTLPVHLQAGSILEIYVKSGQEVKVGDPLVRFDDSMFKYDLKEAESGYQVAAQTYNLAVEKHKNHAFTIEKARLAIEDFKQRRDRAKEQLAIMKKDLEAVLKLSRDKNEVLLTQAEIDRRIVEDIRVSGKQGEIDQLENGMKKSEIDLKEAEAAEESLQGAVRQAAHAATAIKVKIDRATHAISECTLRAKLPGTIEQVTASIGQTVYPMTRPPLFYLVPSGTRIVSVEVVPDFAHRLGTHRVGQTVQITDDSNTHLSYEGKVKRIGSAFLPKASGAPEVISGKSNAVLTVEIEVTDANPAGKPPLRVGQPVRVTFP